MAALSGLRALLVEIHALIAEASRQPGDRSWEQASRSQKVSHLSNRWDKPQEWLPKYLYRWFRLPSRPDVRLALVVHLEARVLAPILDRLALKAQAGTRPAHPPAPALPAPPGQSGRPPDRSGSSP